MTKVANRLFVCFCVATSLAFSSGISAQQSDPSSQPMPKDARTRAIAHTDLGALYFRNGDLIVALEEFTLAAAIDPDYATAFSLRGLVLSRLQEYVSAEKDFQRAMSLDGRNPDIYNNYGWHLCQTGKERESITYFEQAYRNPAYRTPAIAYMNAGSCYSKLNELDLAEEALRMSLRLAPNSSQTLFHLANISYKRENFDAAKKYLTDAMRSANPGPDMLWLALRIEHKLGNAVDAQSFESQLRRIFPESDEYQELRKGNFE